MSSNILHGPEFQPSFTDITLGEFFFRFAKKHGEKICQIDALAGTSESYASVCKRSVRLAIQLHKKGVKSEDIIACCSYNSMDNIIPILAAMFLGAKIGNLDPTLSLRHTKHLLNLTTPKIIFVENSSLDLIENSLKDLISHTEIIVFGESEKYVQFSELIIPDPMEENFQPWHVDVKEIAVLLFSSGTTGMPKAICHSHYSFLLATESVAELNLDSSVLLHYSTFYWISALLLTTLAFLKGNTRVFCVNLDGEIIFQAIEKYQLTLLFMAPTLTYNITNFKNPQKYDTSSVRCILTGGTPISEQQFAKLAQLLSSARILFCYGLTELGYTACFNDVDYDNLIKKKSRSCGRTLPNMHLKVVDPDTDKILAANQKGEIRVKFAGSMLGHYKMDSSSCFDADGYLKTGDIGYFDDDKCLYVEGRIKEMFKYKSWHIVPSLIEGVLLEHPDVAECAVVGLPVGEDGEVPAACIVLKPNSKTVKEEIEEFVAERVSDREKLRGGVTITKHLPKTPTGKLIRRDIQECIIKTNTMKYLDLQNNF